ncbi:TonB-dependent siderophore receptor [Parvibaculum lavamentivorans DS-1]|uniref:TonB-dependent siderophore receptor n=1 Tax=Parvibaculum lavamentivorans (strain DS-1 / DSM 13023 / NCIMB 13966) TaxID=402881 RepID=A7HUU5_PARL1|nr:TonB-dependent siderophore receptor [Parvibaculum lavamentivorans]ABS63678.1 TonB-dependent siderophore receptor [Parvibaculum lavamentivorans DS-1]
MSFLSGMKPRGSRVLCTILLASVSTAALAAMPALAQEEAGDAAVELAPIKVESDKDALPAPYAGGQVAAGARIGVLGNQDIMDVPFSVTSYTEELIRNQQAETIGDVVANDPSVRTGYGFSIFGEQFVIRGFPLSNEDIAFNGMYGISPRQIVGTTMYECVEVLKGASAFLNGAPPSGSGTGGSINLVPKRATDVPIRRVTGSYSMNSQFGAHADVGQRFGANNAWGIRINVAGRDGETAIENEDRQYLLGSLALDYRGERLRLSLDAASQRQLVEQGRTVVQLAGGIAVPEPVDSDHNYAQEWAYYDMHDTFALLQGEYDITDFVTAYAGFGAREMREDSDGSTPRVSASDGTATMSRFTVPREDTVYSGQGGLRFEFETGPLRHNLNLGASWLEQKNYNSFEFTGGTPTNIYDPVLFPRPAGGTRSGSFSDLPLFSYSELTSTFLSDTIVFLDDKVHLTLGLRDQRIQTEGYDRTTGAVTSSYDESEISPVAGLAVNLTEQVTVYANRIEGLAQGPTAPTTAGVLNPGEIFAPYTSVQYEFGGKVDLGKVGFGAAYFETEKPLGILTPVGGGNSVFGVDGEQRNRGVELNFFGEPAEGIRLLGGITFLDAELTSTASGANDGNQVRGVPDYQANLGAEWDMPFLPGMTALARVLHTDSQYVDDANTQKISDWTRLDIGARYTANFDRQPVTFNLFIENVTNESYWAAASADIAGYLTMGDPLTAKFSVSTEF